LFCGLNFSTIHVYCIERAHRIRAGLVALGDGDDDGDIGALEQVDDLLSLRLDAIVGRDDQDGDVGHAGAPGSHGLESGMAGGVEKGDGLAARLGRLATGAGIERRERDLEGADMLGDAAGLALGDRGGSEGVEQGRLAVIDVAHDADDRRSDRLQRRLGMWRAVRGDEISQASHTGT
jgi:hypothetical protein